MREIQNSKKWFNNLLYLVLYFIAILLISFFMKSPWILLIGFAFPFIFLFFTILLSEHAINSVKSQKFPENLIPEQQDHDALIVIHSMGIHSIGNCIGIDNLIRYFYRKNYPFKIYHCYDADDLIKILKNDRSKYLWIFGHGWRGGITFKFSHTLSVLILRKNHRIFYDYSNLNLILNEIPKKKFIAQLHCNHISQFSELKNVTLIEMILEDSLNADYYVTEREQHVLSIWFATRFLRMKAEGKRNPMNE